MRGRIKDAGLVFRFSPVREARELPRVGSYNDASEPVSEVEKEGRVDGAF